MNDIIDIFLCSIGVAFIILAGSIGAVLCFCPLIWAFIEGGWWRAIVAFLSSIFLTALFLTLMMYFGVVS